ncbi:MAG: anaerobic sulfatase maturase [Saccharofermentanales bacterium]
MKTISLLIKPVSGSCQLRCRYCFYTDVANSRDVANYGVMTPKTLETLVSRAIGESDEMCSFAFQGGEPTLAGLDFYRMLVDLQKKHNIRHIGIHNAIQTNGIALDDAWCEFFAINKFLVGLSLDGSREIHDANRIDASGRGSFSKVIRAASLMDRHKVDYNILCVVTSQLARRAEHVYHALKERGFRYLQFIPCIDDFGAVRGSSPYSLTHQRYSEFLCRLFDLWHADYIAGDYISIRHFDNWIQMFAGMPPETCSMSGRCVCYGVVEADGSVYPCDFYVLDEWRLGSIKVNTFTEMLTGGKAADFVDRSSVLPPKCAACRFAGICRNGCRRDREPLDGVDGSISYYCSAYKDFFRYAGARMAAIAKTVR